LSNDNSYTIRPIEGSDIEKIANWMVQIQLWQRYNLTVPIIIERFQLAMTNQEIISVITAENQDEPLGFARVLPKGMFGQQAYLKQISVHHEYSGMGLGTQLLQHIEVECRADSDRLFLLVSAFNTSAQQFYEHNGYQQIGRIPSYILAGVDELLYYKRLKK
jgi:ribosomal protein S18 acetylase RimI-like enzyme